MEDRLRKWAGGALLSVPFVALFCFQALDAGLWDAIQMFALIGVGGACVVFGANLLHG